MTEEMQELFELLSDNRMERSESVSNRRKHGIDFDEAIGALYRPVLLRRCDRNNEERWLAIGEADTRVIAIAFTWRGDTLRIISARRARKNEERSYRQTKMGRASEGQD